MLKLVELGEKWIFQYNLEVGKMRNANRKEKKLIKIIAVVGIGVMAILIISNLT